MSRSTISTFKLFELFPDESSARKYLESRLWKDERSHVPLHKWLYAMYLLVTARKGISSMQLAKEIGITQKSAWFVLHRLREAVGVYHKASKKHLHRYVDEFTFRSWTA